MRKSAVGSVRFKDTAQVYSGIIAYNVRGMHPSPTKNNMWEYSAGPYLGYKLEPLVSEGITVAEEHAFGQLAERCALVQPADISSVTTKTEENLEAGRESRCEITSCHECDHQRPRQPFNVPDV